MSYCFSLVACAVFFKRDRPSNGKEKLIHERLTSVKATVFSTCTMYSFYPSNSTLGPKPLDSPACERPLFVYNLEAEFYGTPSERFAQINKVMFGFGHTLVSRCKASADNTITFASEDGFCTIRSVCLFAGKPMRELSFAEQHLLHTLDTNTAEITDHVHTGGELHTLRRCIAVPDHDIPAATGVPSGLPVAVYGPWAPAYRHVACARAAAMFLSDEEKDLRERTVWEFEPNEMCRNDSQSVAWVAATLAGRSESHEIICHSGPMRSNGPSRLVCRTYETKEQAKEKRDQHYGKIPWFFSPEVPAEDAEAARARGVEPKCIDVAAFESEFTTDEDMYLFKHVIDEDENESMPPS